MESSSGGEIGKEPVLPIFIQMNARLVEEDDQWKEVSRWVKFQENVEDGGKRWSKPHVPSCSFSVMTGVRDMLEKHPVILDSTADNIHSIIEEVLNKYPHLEASQSQKIQQLFTQGVKQKMKISLVRQMSKTSVTGSRFLRQESQMEDPLLEEDEEGSNRRNKSAPTTPDNKRRSNNKDGAEEEEDKTPVKRRHFSVTTNPILNKSERRVSYKDETYKYREYNLFSKKVPKEAEVANIQVSTCEFLDEMVFAFVRLKNPVLLEDFCELQKPTRFLALILGPQGSGAQYLEMGRALGTLFTDQLFCGQTAYKSSSSQQLVEGLDLYMQELTVLPPSSWDPNIRLDPPKSTQTLQSRLANRATIRLTSLNESEGNDELPLIGIKEDQVNHTEDDGLQFTGRLFGGLMDDIRRKIPWYVSDFKDALHIQTFASIIYIYLATVTKAITFGGFLGDTTDGLQGVLESFLGHALAGGMFCLFGGQPLTVLGCTGPVLIFEKILVGFCSSNGLDYLTLRLWIGLWSALFCLIIVAVDGSAIVRYFTRFTEEAFAALVGIIFIVEALKKLWKTGKQFKVHRGLDPDILGDSSCICTQPSYLQANVDTPEGLDLLNQFNIPLKFQENSTTNATFSTDSVGWSDLTMSQCKMLHGDLEGGGCKYSPDIFFFSVILFFGTFLFCSTLKKFKLSPFFPTKIRSLVSDYAVILTIIIFVLVDLAFDLATPKLIVPTEFKPTRSDVRGWFIPLFDEKSAWYVYLLASIPALLLTILLFMDQQITSVIVNRKEHKLKKGGGYHLDMLIVGVMMGVCSLLGLPWCVAATVLCLGHVDSLKMDTESSAPGETPKFLGVREQRVTGVMVFILTGLSVKLAPVLKFIPMPVLYGVLLYMGVNTLNGMQFIDRCFLLFMPAKHQPDYLYLRHVPLKKVHLFTLIQAAALASLWVIKSTPASLVFPLMVLALVGFRKVMDYFPSIFSQKDLYWLDNLMPQSDKSKKKKKRKFFSKKNKKSVEEGSEEEMKGLKSNGDTIVA